MLPLLTINPLLIAQAVRHALDEDLGHMGDLTTLAVVPQAQWASGVIAARQPGILAGLPVAKAAFQSLDIAVQFTNCMADGSQVKPGDIITRLEGPARVLLSAERVALNFMGRLSGIATLTARFVEQVAGTGAKIVDTRKTTPGLRAFEKYAVRCGGGMNHRFGLDDAILIKDNHIAVAGGVAAALTAAQAAAGHLVKIEIEVDTLDQLDQVLAHGGADVVLLDNMSIPTLETAVRKVAGRIKTEASGGVTLEHIRQIAETGVDMISIGALTHSASVLDTGLDLNYA